MGTHEVGMLSDSLPLLERSADYTTIVLVFLFLLKPISTYNWLGRPGGIRKSRNTEITDLYVNAGSQIHLMTLGFA